MQAVLRSSTVRAKTVPFCIEGLQSPALGAARIYVVYLSEELGGQAAAELIRDRVFSVLQMRKIAAPTRTFDVLNLVGLPEATLARALDSAKDICHTSTMW
jgi:hypothetical protein